MRPSFQRLDLSRPLRGETGYGIRTRNLRGFVSRSQRQLALQHELGWCEHGRLVMAASVWERESPIRVRSDYMRDGVESVLDSVGRVNSNCRSARAFAQLRGHQFNLLDVLRFFNITAAEELQNDYDTPTWCGCREDSR
jgi:hypothetical protein